MKKFHWAEELTEGIFQVEKRRITRYLVLVIVVVEVLGSGVVIGSAEDRHTEDDVAEELKNNGSRDDLYSWLMVNYIQDELTLHIRC